MAANAKPKGTFIEVQGAVRRLQRQGEVLIDRIGKDAKAFATKGRAELVRDMKKVQTRVDRSVKDLERTLVKRLHAATEERVGKLEARVAELERRFSDVVGVGEDAV